MTLEHQDPIPGAACRPNFTGAGRRRRRSLSAAMAVVTTALFVALVATDASAWVRFLVALPAIPAALIGLQVARNTCVMHAAAGTVEHDDFSTTKADAAFAAASRAVARTIYRDAIAIGLLVGAAAAASAWIM